MKPTLFILILLCACAALVGYGRSKHSPRPPELLPPSPATMTVTVGAVSVTGESAAAAAPAAVSRWRVSWSYTGPNYADISFNLFGDADPNKVRSHFLTNVPGTARFAVWETTSPQFFFTASTFIP